MSRLTPKIGSEYQVPMDHSELDQLKQTYNEALERCIAAIRDQQTLLENTGHSARSEDAWKQAEFALDDANERAKKARQEYEEAVRKTNFGF